MLPSNLAMSARSLPHRAVTSLGILNAWQLGFQSPVFLRRYLRIHNRPSTAFAQPAPRWSPFLTLRRSQCSLDSIVRTSTTIEHHRVSRLRHWPSVSVQAFVSPSATSRTEALFRRRSFWFAASTRGQRRTELETLTADILAVNLGYWSPPRCSGRRRVGPDMAGSKVTIVVLLIAGRSDRPWEQQLDEFRMPYKIPKYS